MMVSLKMEAGNGAELCMGPRFINIDPDTLCAFRRNNVALINESFVRVLEMAAQWAKARAEIILSRRTTPRRLWRWRAG